jgi:hypothetical protein
MTDKNAPRPEVPTRSEIEQALIEFGQGPGSFSAGMRAVDRLYAALAEARAERDPAEDGK